MLSFLKQLLGGDTSATMKQTKASLKIEKAMADLPQRIGQTIEQSVAKHLGTSQSDLNRLLLLSGQLASMRIREQAQLATLADAEFRVTSQWGEDGIIEWLLSQLPQIPRSFIEFGVENYSEANTRFLLQNRGWKGLILDGNSEYMKALQDQPLYWMHDLTAVGAFITAENINDLIASNNFAGDLGLLSVDIDGNDYWVLKAINCVNPAIIVCEVNGVFGDLRAITVPYAPAFDRLKAHHSGQYFGCSIRALRCLCEGRGYTYVGTNSNGVNAFFVRNDLAEPIRNKLQSVRTWPARHRDSRDQGGKLTFTRGTAKCGLISHMPVVDLDSGRTAMLGELMPLYSLPYLAELN